MTTPFHDPDTWEPAPDGLFVVHGELLSSDHWDGIDGFALPRYVMPDTDFEWAGLDGDVLADAPAPPFRSA